MAIIYSPEHFISVEQLKEDFASGNRSFLSSAVSIRSKVNQENVEAKKQQLLFVNSDNSRYCQIINFLVFFVNKEGKRELLNGNTRVRALFEMLVDPKYKDVEFKPVPFKDLEDGWTVDDLYSVQMSFNDTTNPHEPLDLAVRIHESKNRYVDLHQATSNLKPKFFDGQVTKYLCDTFKLSEMQIGRYLRVAQQPTEVKELLDKNVLTISDIIDIDRATSKLGKTAVEIVEDLKGLTEDPNKISSNLIKNYVLSRTPEDPNKTPTTTVTNGTGKGSGNTTPKVDLVLDPSEFDSRTSDVLNKLTILPQFDFTDKDIREKSSDDVAKTVRQTLRSLGNVTAILTVEDLVPVLPAIVQLSSLILGNLEHIKKRVTTNDLTPGGFYQQNILGVEKAVNALIDALTAPPKVEKAEATEGTETTTEPTKKPKKSKKSTVAETTNGVAESEVIEVPTSVDLGTHTVEVF